MRQRPAEAGQWQRSHQMYHALSRQGAPGTCTMLQCAGVAVELA